jgi:cytochrome c-type biogenesis protein CcmH/NrfF
VRRATALALALIFAFAAPAAAVAQQCPRTSQGDIEDEVMCVLCKRPLNTVDREPQAQRERAYIQTLIDQCKSKDQIKDALVAQFGPKVLALPNDGGFDATAYIVPVAAPLAALAAIALAATRWRRRRPDPALAVAVAGDQPTRTGEREPLDADDAARLDDDLERYDL